jgi:threonine aldolase
MPQQIIELRSDTKTQPSPGMRAAMAAAAVGDEQAGEDPSVNALCERVAALLGKSRGLFLPSGTMCNLIAVMVHCRHGDEILAADVSHLMSSESGGSGLSGALIRALPSQRGIFTGAQVRAAVRPQKINAPKSRLVHVEQTVNRGGGAIWSLAALSDVSRAVKESGLSLHMDGARLMNAVVAAMPTRNNTASSATASGSICPRASAVRSAQSSSAMTISSPPRYNGSSGLAGPCGRRVWSPRRASTRSTTISSGCASIMTMRGS